MWKLTSIVWVAAIFNLICFTVEVQKMEVDSISHAAMFNLCFIGDVSSFLLKLWNISPLEWSHSKYTTVQPSEQTLLSTLSLEGKNRFTLNMASTPVYGTLAHLEWFRKFIIRLWHLHSRVCMLLILNHMWFNNWLYLGLVFFNGILEIHLNSLFLILSLCKYINF